MIGQKIIIKPLSANEMWKGGRIKSAKYRKFQNNCLFLLNSKIEIPKGKIVLYLQFGFRSAASDVDNPVKAFTDVLSKKYGFNDNKIYMIIMHKTIVDARKDYIEFAIKEYHPDLWDNLLKL